MTEAYRRRATSNYQAVGERCFAVTVGLTEDEINRLERFAQAMEMRRSEVGAMFIIRSIQEWEDSR